MGINLGSLSGLLGPALTVGTQAAGAGLAGQQAGQEANQAKMLQMIALIRQKHEQEIKDQLAQAQMAHLGAQTDLMRQPPDKTTVLPPGSTLLRGDNPVYTAPDRPEKPTNPLMGSPEWKEAERFRASLQPKPQPNYTILQPGNPNAPAQAVNTKNPRDVVELPFAKAQGGAGGSASLAPADRAKMLAQAQLDHKTMKEIEQKWMANGSAPNPVTGAAGAVSELHGPIGSMVAPFGNAAVAAMDPDYQRYLTAQASFGRVMANLQSKRYSDVQQQIEKTISGRRGGDLEATAKYKEQLRDAALNDPAIQPSTAGAPAPAKTGGGRGGAGKTMSPAAYQEARKWYSDNEIRAQGYTIPKGNEE